MTVAVWDKRGPIAGAVALVFYGVMFTVTSFRHEEVMAASRSHPLLDTLILPPLLFLAVAYSSDLDLWKCALVAAAGWLVLLPFTLRTRRRAAASGT